MPGKSGGNIIGYRYYMGMHMAVCLGADELLGITVGDRILWGEYTKVTETWLYELDDQQSSGFQRWYDPTDVNYEAFKNYVAEHTDTITLGTHTTTSYFEGSTNTGYLEYANWFGETDGNGHIVIYGYAPYKADAGTPPTSTPYYYKKTRLEFSSQVIFGVKDEHVTTRVTTTTDITVNKEELFGGDKREGGIAGTVGVLFGGPGQQKDPYLSSMFGKYTPAFKGVLSVVLKHIYIGVNPYLKNWGFLVKRIPFDAWQVTGLDSNGQPKTISNVSRIVTNPDSGYVDANPAAIIGECLTNDDYGMGYPLSKLDYGAGSTFDYAAFRLHEEGFGLAMIWDQQAPIQDFIQQVLNHINGVLEVSPRTGKFELKLIRGDYDPNTQPVFNESNIIELESFHRAAWGETINEVTVQYIDRMNAKPRMITVQDIANIQVQAGVSSVTHTYKGIADSDLAYKVAQRDLQVLSTPLSKVKFTANREAYLLGTGDVFWLRWPRLGINAIYRAGTVSYGTVHDNKITIEAVEDVFALPYASYVKGVTQTPVHAPQLPVPVVYRRMLEVNFWDLCVYMYSHYNSPVTNIVDTAMSVSHTQAWVFGVAKRMFGISSGYRFQTYTDTNFEKPDGDWQGYYSPSFWVEASLPAEPVSTNVPVSHITDAEHYEEGSYGYIGDEIIQIQTIHTDVHNNVTGLTLQRGMLDTTPQAHAPTMAYMVNRLFAASTTEYIAGDIVKGLVLPVHPRGTLTPSVADAGVSVEVVGRVAKPYPVGKFRLASGSNGFSYYPTSLSKSATISVSWAHRNRRSQTLNYSVFAKQTDDNLSPEPGVTYDVEIMVKDGNTLLQDWVVVSGGGNLSSATDYTTNPTGTPFVISTETLTALDAGIPGGLTGKTGGIRVTAKRVIAGPVVIKNYQSNSCFFTFTA